MNHHHHRRVVRITWVPHPTLAEKQQLFQYLERSQVIVLEHFLGAASVDVTNDRLTRGLAYVANNNDNEQPQNEETKNYIRKKNECKSN